MCYPADMKPGIAAAIFLLALAAPALAQNKGDVWPTTPGSGSLEDRRAKAEQKGRELDTKLGDDEELVRKYVRRGMGVEEVRELLGEPRGATASSSAGNYLCLGYGRVWVVFEDGQAACLRSRLEYVPRYDSNCHCAGNAMNIIPFAKP